MPFFIDPLIYKTSNHTWQKASQLLRRFALCLIQPRGNRNMPNAFLNIFSSLAISTFDSVGAGYLFMQPKAAQEFGE